MDARIDRIRDEIAASPNDSMIAAIGEFLTAMAEQRAETLDRISDEKKSIAGAIAAMRSAAEKKRGKGNCVALDYVSGMKIALAYYGITMTEAEIIGIALRAAQGGEAQAEAQADTAADEDEEFDLDALLAEG